MHFTNIVLPLAAAGLSVASPLLEQRADGFCSSVPKISSLVNAVYKPSAVPFCNSLLGVSVTTVTEHSTRTAKTLTSTATVTAGGTLTVHVTVKANGGATSSVTAAPQTATGEVVPKNPIVSAQTVTTNSTATVAARDLWERAAKATPSRLATLSTKMLSSVCSCLTKATMTTTVTSVIGTRTTQIDTTTVTKSPTATVTQTTTAAAVPFYVKIAKNSNTNADGQFAVVDGESMSFQAAKANATTFTINSGHLVSGSNGWVANMQSGAQFSTLFFDSPDLIAQLGLVEVGCNRKTGPLSCSSQNATSFFYCETVGAGLVFAPADYASAGCTKVTLNTVNA